MPRNNRFLPTFCFSLLLLCAVSSGRAGEQRHADGDATTTSVVISGIVFCSPLPTSDDEAMEFDETFDDEYADEFADEYADEEETAEDLPDPLSGWNRVWFHFNDKMHFWVLKPVSKGYGYVVPSPLRKGFRNVFHNLGMPGRLVNTSLQGHGKCAATELTRFVINSTVGVAGLWDPASNWFHLKNHSEDFDQTLGKWGMGQGIYLTWPILGPSSLRGTLAAPVDMALDPVSLVPGGSLVKRINNMSLEEDFYKTVVDMSLDPYTTIRSVYVQNRQHQVDLTH